MNDQPPIRDALLLKCKQAIEDLHGEIDRSSDDNGELRMQNQLLQRDIERIQEKVKFIEREGQRQQDEIKRWKQKAQQSEQKVEYLEEQVKAFQINSDRYEEIRINFTELAEQNIGLKSQLDQALNDIDEKNQLKNEWDKEIDQVSRRIQDFQEDNRNLEIEKQQLEQNSYRLDQIIKEQEQQLRSVNERLQDFQKKEQQLKRTVDQARSYQSDYESATQTIDKQKRQMDIIKNDHDKIIQDNERYYTKKLSDLNNQLQRERENMRSDAFGDVEKLQRMADSLQLDIARVREEKERTQNEFFECRDALLQKEFQVKEIREDYQIKFDQMQKNNYEEMKKLQHIIDDQSELIHSYERVIEREKDEVGRRQDRVGQGEIKQKEQIIELTNKNSFLQIKLVECQKELQRIQGEVNTMFQQEESKNASQLQSLEYQMDHYKQQLQDKEKEIEKLKTSYKKKKHDYSFVESDKKNLVKEIQDREYKIEELERERNIRFHDFDHMQSTLQRRIEELMNELEHERKIKINESRVDNNHRVEDKIRNIEDYYKQEIEYLKTELFRKEKDFDQIQGKYDKSIQKILSNRSFAQQSGNLQEVKPPLYIQDELRTQKLPGFTNQDVKSKTQHINSSKDNRYQSDNSFQKSETDKSQIDHPERDEKRRSHTSKNKDIKSKNETEFLSKFQHVIARMENKLEKMQNELNIEAKPIRRKN